MILLTDEANPYYDPHHDREACGDSLCKEELVAQHAFNEGAKAQLKQVVEWLYSTCDTYGHNGYHEVKDRAYCWQCRQSLLDEVKGA